MYEKNKKTFQKILFFIADSSFYLQRTFKLKAQKGGKKLANENLHKAKEAKNDEFYTQLNDVSEELRHYKEHFKDKIIFCNCDDPTWSAFWRYFHLNFEHLGLKKLISTHYDREKPTYKMEYTGGNDNDIEAGVKTPLEGNGDFRNQECIDLLKEADIVVTNPPFSIAREDFIPQLFEYKKKFLIIGDLNWVTYKIIFPLLKNNEMWMGYSAVKEFLQPDGTIKKFGNKLWFTNLDIKKRHEKLILWKNYTSAEFPRYDNYDAINVDKVSNIPCDYCESWEVTEDEFKNFSADEWEITRTGELDGEKSFFIIPAADTELRKLLHEHATGYKEEIEKEIIKRIQKNINNDRLPSGRQAAERQKDTVTESLECQSPSLTKDKIMRILAIDKYEEPVVKEIENNLKDMQRYVLGHIETITLSETAMLVCNDVGKLANLTPNRILKIGNSHDVIRGDFFICGWSGDEFCDISDEDVEKYTKMFSKPDVLFMPVWNGVSRVWKIVKPEDEKEHFCF